MTRTDEKVRYSPESKRVDYTPQTAAQSTQNVIRVLEGRWKLVILFQLFGQQARRFSELERAIPGVSQKMMESWRASSMPRCRPRWSIT